MKTFFAVAVLATTLTVSAYAGQDEITVYLDGPISLVATTDKAGAFVLTGIPPGTYDLSFEYKGREVRYRGRSGKNVSVTVGKGQGVEVTGLTVRGGQLNIGNVHAVRGGASEKPGSEEPPVEVDLTGTWSITTGSSQTVVTLQHAGTQLSGEVALGTLTGAVTGQEVTMTVTATQPDGIDVTTTYVGTITSENAMSGTWMDGSGGQGQWQANRM